MTGHYHDSAFNFLRIGKLLALIGLLFFLSAPAHAQNTKGDKAEVKGSSPKRDNRFNPFKRKQKGKPSYNRAVSKGVTRAGSAWQADKKAKAQKIYPQKGRFVHNPSAKPSKKNPATPPHRRVMVRSKTGKTKNVYPQYGRYVNNPSRTPKSRQPSYSNKTTVTRLKKLQSGPSGSSSGKIRVIPRSASGSFIARKSINVYANFPRPKKKGERAYTRDIAGRKLRTKNYETPRPDIIAPTFKPYQHRKRVGERPYSGPAAGSYRSATRSRQQAWTGDIAGRKIRGKNFSSKKRVEGLPMLAKRRRPQRFGDQPYRGIIPGAGAKSRSGSRGAGSAIPGKAPGRGAMGIGNYTGNIRGGRKFFNDQGEGFTGMVKARRPLKGGGSVSGKLWNNQGRAIAPRGFKYQGENFSGSLKGNRPAKGGGSVSGKMWNNQGRAVAPRGYANQGEGYAGGIKSRRPAKGGGSVSSRMWNNQGRAIAPKGYANQGEGYSGGIKSKRPAKGGGSISGKLWNNKETPISPRTYSPQGESYAGNLKVRRPGPSAHAKNASGFPGKRKLFQDSPGFADQGEEYTGHLKVKRKKETKKDEPIHVKTPPASAKKIGGYPGKMKRFENQPGFADQGEEFTGYIRRPRLWKDYVKNPNSSEESLKKKRPTSTTLAVDGLHVRVKTRPYVKHDKSAEEALRKLKPTETTMSTGGLQVRVKQSKYIKNPSSADEALKVREPGKAFARATDYQGNIKMQKFKLFEKNRNLHPDAKFVKTNKNNVPSEKDALTNFKLWWARLFRKQETQPDHLKEKGKKPRYDKGEDGLWYE